MYKYKIIESIPTFKGLNSRVHACGEYKDLIYKQEELKQNILNHAPSAEQFIYVDIVRSDGLLLLRDTYESSSKEFTPQIRHLGEMTGQIYFRDSILDRLFKYVKATGMSFHLCCSAYGDKRIYAGDGFGIPYESTPFKDKDELLDGIILSLPEGTRDTIHRINVNLNNTANHHLHLWSKRSVVEGDFILYIGETFPKTPKYDIG